MGGSSNPQPTYAPSFQNQTTTKDPWAPSQGALNQALQGAQSAYGSTYQGPQIAEYDPLVTQGQNQIVANAGGGEAGGLAGDALSGLRDILSRGGLGALQRQGGEMIGGAGATNEAASGYLDPYASGQYLQPGQNPYLDSTIQSAMNDASRGVNSQFSAGGRYGSGAHADALANRLGTIATGARMGDYNQQQQNQLNAIDRMGSLSTGRAGIGGLLSDLGQRGVSNLFGAGAGIEGLSTARNIDASNLKGVGAERMDYRQQLIDAANQAPWARVSNLANIAGGIGGLGGTSNTSGFSMQPQQQQQGGSKFGQILGGVSAGAGALANILPLFSDKRLKENIKPAGKTDDGQRIYAYNYKADPSKRRMMGLLAQEVKKKKPEAVVRDPESGYLMVDYGKALA